MNILKPYLGIFSYLILLALLSIGLTAMSAHSHNIDLNHIGDELEVVGFKDDKLLQSESKSTTKNSLNQSYTINFAANIPEDKKTQLYTWAKHARKALRLVYGKLPVEDFVTIIKAIKGGKGAVPWGEVNRYSPPEVTLVVNLDSSLEALKADWTIYHEFSHLLIPYDAGDARWFSEGLASYYQNITQARVGMFDEKTLWQKLYDGFERGNKQQKYAHQRLDYLSDHISENRNYMRIYWSGALYWLKADIALRALAKKNAPLYSLDLALAQLQACCFDRYLSATEIAHKLDQLTESKIFTSLLSEFSASYAIPDYLIPLRSLGVEVINGQISINDQAIYSTQRRAIFIGLSKLSSKNDR